ncbi:hypothetical protein Tco_0565557 [Tanacetum coccineum]
MIGSLMYLTSSRPDIMFTVCACARFQVSPKTSHLLAVKRIFRYLKGKPSLGLWYSKDSPLELVAYTDSDYAGATLDRKSTTRGCQFLGNRLISWQCKKQTVVATSYKRQLNIVAACKLLWNADLLTKGFDAGRFQYLVSRSNSTAELYITLFVKLLLIVRSAEILTDDNGNVKIHATIDGHSLSITEGSLRRHLKLDDQIGQYLSSNYRVFGLIGLMGYATDSDKLTFQKVHVFTAMEVFSNMKRSTKGFSGQEVALFPTMLNATEPSPSPSRITSSPSPTPTPSLSP